MKSLTTIIGTTLLVGGLAFCASAQDTTRIEPVEEISNYEFVLSVDELEGSEYYDLLEQVKDGEDIDFLRLRMSYTQTDEYNPLAYVMLGNQKEELAAHLGQGEFEEAIGVANELFEVDFLDIDNHLMAAYAYDQLGDTIKTDYHKRIIGGLIESILESGDGKTPETAFVVTYVREEYNVLDAFRLQLTQQSLIGQDNFFFDEMKVVDSENNPYTIYFNVDFPMAKLNEILSGEMGE